MASKKKKKRVIRKRSSPVKKKTPLRKAKRVLRRPQVKRRAPVWKSKKPVRKANPGRDLATALTDLTKIFPRKTLARQLRITPRQVTIYKTYRKRSPLPPKKEKAILAFYRKLQLAKNRENLKYSYHVTGARRRITPVKWVTVAEINDVVRSFKGKNGVKKAAKLIGVSEGTILRWRSGQGGRIKPKNRKGISRAHKKTMGESYDGVFSITREFRTVKGPAAYAYTFIAFYTAILYKNPQDFIRFVGDDTGYQVNGGELINHPKKFTEAQAIRFIQDHMIKIKKSKNVSLWEKSVDALKRFVDTEFKGKAQERLIDVIDNASHGRKKKRIIRKSKNTKRKSKANNKNGKKAKKSKIRKNKKIVRNNKANNKKKKRN